MATYIDEAGVNVVRPWHTINRVQEHSGVIVYREKKNEESPFNIPFPFKACHLLITFTWVQLGTRSEIANKAIAAAE